jgi:methionine aminotransferase
VGLASYLDNELAYESLPDFFQAKRDYFLELMRGSPFEFLDSKGSYFILASYKGISRQGDKEFAVRLTKDYGVAVIPVSVFYRDGKDDKVIRFCFAKAEKTLEEAAQRLGKLT